MDEDIVPAEEEHAEVEEEQEQENEEEQEIEQEIEEETSQGRRRSRRKTKSKKTNVTKSNELDVACNTINDIITEFMYVYYYYFFCSRTNLITNVSLCFSFRNDNPFKKEIQDFKKDIEMHLFEQV
jgi:hypothetical protein